MNDVNTEKVLELIIGYIQAKKGEDIVVIDLRGISNVADYFVIATGSVDIHLKAIADELREKMKHDHGITPWHVEGYDALKWVLLDFVDIVVHIFDSETRDYFSLENLWKDAEIKRIVSE